MIVSTTAHGQETCSRTAVINQQEVLIDSNATQKGEGLRHYLERDKVASEFLEKYQDGTKVQWHNAALGTIGTSMIISSFFVNSSGSNKKTLLIGGITSIIVNFLMARTFEASNERHLNRAILEYNKRNLPQIEFNQTGLGNKKSNSYKTVYLEKKWSF
ncbi:hypothetical protein [Halobacteriovorax marinus]|uniref:hypothetical protein n=1 Tax=Halobacteriovorax marinus TaxID=97084 RepID=UPI00031F2CEA|nr:hypothetical protein [Halobacteriovorax marinus]